MDQLVSLASKCENNLGFSNFDLFEILKKKIKTNNHLFFHDLGCRVNI